MPSNYDEVVRNNKRYLTQAQINALAAASKEYSIQNAGNRAGALSQAREQYDTGYRGLQNMGLAGATGAAPTSGEVPRLQQQIKTPFDAYNEKLQQVENKRLTALGANYAQQTQAAQAAAARARAEAEARARAAAEAAQVRYDTSSQAARDEKLALKRAERQQRIAQTAYDTSSQSARDEKLAVKNAERQAGVVNAVYNATVKAAAAVMGIAAPTARQQVQMGTNAVLGINRGQSAGYAPEIVNQSSGVLTTGAGFDTEADKKTLAEAQDRLENMKWTRHYGGRSSVSDADYKAAQDAYNTAKLKVEQPETYASLVVYNTPSMKGTPAYEKAVGVLASEEAKALVKNTYGRDINTTMTYDEFEAAGKDMKQLRTLVDRLDHAQNALQIAQKNKLSPKSIADDQAVVDDVLADLKKLGYTEEEARDLVKNYANDRDARSEIEYYKNALYADMLNDGKRPTKGVNEEETDPTYRAVNNLPDLMRKKDRFVDFLPGSMANAALTDQEFSLGGLWGPWMTDAQRNAYNAIYEKEGVKAANAYLDAIRPLINIEHAHQNAEYAKELANDKVGSTILANLASIPVRAAGSIPAVLEKYIVGGLNALNDVKTGGAGVPMYIDTNSPAHQMSNFASTIRSETSQRILDANRDNPTIGSWANRAYQVGMSMGDSAFNMAFGIAGAPWMTGLLAGSDAANEAYKDARARGGTQQQALAVATAAGIAENVFERYSLEYFTKQWIEKGAAWTRPFITKWALGAGVEGSEEVATSIANLLSDVYFMHDKSEWEQLVQEKGTKQAILDELKNLGWEGLGGAISGGVFGLFGGAFNGVRSYAETTSIGKKAASLGLVQKYEDMAAVLGGKAERTAAKVESKPSAHTVGKMVTQVNDQLSQAFTGNEQTDIPMALLFSGKQLSFTEANDVYQALGSEKLEKMGYKADSARSFMNSFNERMVDTGIYARTQERMKESQANLANMQAEEYLGMTDQMEGTEYNEKNVAQNKAMREALEKRVWKNPNVGTAVTDDGTEVAAMPGNMTRVGWAEMNRKNFKAQSTVTNGRATYELSSMAMRDGMTNDESYAAMRENMQDAARKSADFYENLANTLGLDIVIHDVMRGSNGFLQDGKLHVVLSSRQNAVRIASHELTHYMKAHSPEKFNNLQEHLIREVGQEEFNRLVANKAAFYGFDTSTRSGLANAREEVCAELCERMLSNEQMLQRFAQRETDTARAMKSHLEQTVDAIHKALTGNEQKDFGRSASAMIKGLETMDSWIDGLTDAIANAEAQKKTMEGNIALTAGVTVADQNGLVEDLSKAKTDEELDDAYTEFSVDVIEYDLAGYMQDLQGVMTADEINDLYDTMTAAIDMVKAHRAILDYGTELTTEEEIQQAKKGRAYMPYKQNADPHYKLALDFSTLCRKRVLLQTIQERLQAKLGRALSQEETVAVRLELQKLQREGYKVEVACALCYVEAARLKSPKVINTFLNNTEAEMRNYFAQKNPASKNIILGMQQQWKVDHDYTPDTTKKQMSSADVTAFNTYSRSIREQFESDHPAEQVTIQRAIDLANDKHVMIGGIEFPGRETFLSASWLTKLKGIEPDIFNAFTDKVRSATRSKAQETDTFYSRGDIDMVTESILNYANAESGFRHQSWSDFVPTHLLDTMAAVIEMSTRKGKMHAYTKVPSMVEFLGKTGMMMNMSLIPAGDTGLNVDGSLAFDTVEGMAWETMMRLRDMFPDTAGNIAIGIGDEQIKKLLDSNDVDYVIPYHASGMNKNMRGYMDIRAWSEYTSSQNEKTNHRGPKGPAPELKEWFDEEAAAKATDGYAFMRAASEKYLQLCFKRHLIPKFSQYLQNNGDGSYSLKEGYENYWKLLIDRKMVNQKTGGVIIQQAVKPTFDQRTVLGILEDRVNDPAIQDAEKAANIVTEKLSGWQANRNNASAEAIQEAKNIRDRTAAITAQKTAEAMHSVDELEAAEENLKYSLADEDTAKALDNDEMVKVYRAMQLIDGKLYPPMAAKVKDAQTGKATLAQPTEVGRWYVSDERPDLIDPKTGKWKLDKGNKSSPINAAYNPYFHTSLSPLNDQFSSAYNRPNLVIVEGYVPKSELTSGYKAQYAKDSVGAMRWHSGPVSSHLSTPRTVILSRYFKANRVMSDAEVASKVADLVKGENVSIPQNTVTPGLYSELQKLGVPTTAMYSLDEESPAQYSAETIEQLEGVSEFLDQISKGDAQLREKLISALMPVIEEKVTASEKKASKPVQTVQKKPGMKPAGKQPRVRDVSVPQYAKTGNPVSDFARSFLESDKATEEMVADLQEKIESGEWGSYTRLTNKEAMATAQDFIAKRTVAQAQTEFHDMVESGKYNVNTRAIGLQLLAEAARRGDQEAVLNIATDLRELATDAGQSVQIFSVLKELGGFGSAWYMQKKIDKLNAKYAKEIASGKMNEITVSPDLMQDLAEARTTAEIEKAEDEIAKEIARQLPLTWESRISNWRYLAMLGNPTTHFRNITGNFFMAGLNTTKDAVATAIERFAVRDVSKRAHAVLTLKDKQTWGGFADKSYNEQEKVLRGNGKFGFETQLRQYMRAFDTKWLNKLAEFNFNALENEDMRFIKPAYRNALMQYMKAQGYQLRDGVAGKMVDGEFKAITTEQMTAAQEWAAQQAWKATFHDASVVADLLNNASKKLGKVGNVLIEGVMPFKKTPINIAKRGIEYSPAGVIMGIVQLSKDVRTGKVSTAQAVDNIASGITGMTLMAVGAFLAKMGILRSGGEEKKKHETYLSDTGDQTYALKIGKYSIGLSALAPATIPMFMGAALFDALDRNGEGVDLSAITETIANTLNPFMEMSFMSSLNSALKNYNNNGIGGALGNTLLTAAESYGSQFLPTVVGKLGQFADPTARTTKSSAASKVGSNLDYYARSLARKVPGLEATLEPDVDVWGRTTNKGNPLTKDGFQKWALDFANKFIFPANVKIENKTAIDDELIRVVESTGNVDILPSDGAKYFTVKGEKYPMTAAQYTEFSQDRGIASYAALKETMSTDAYWDATDEEKANMLQNALSAAQKQVNTVWKEKLGAVEPAAPKQETTVKDIQGDYSDPALYKVAATYPNAYDKAAKAKSKGVSPDTFLDLYEKKESYIGEDRSDYVRQQIMDSNLSVQQKELMDDLIVSDKGQNPDYSSPTWFKISMLGKTRYDEAKKGEKVGLKPETYLQVYNKWKTIDAKDANGNTVNGLKKKRAKEYLDSLPISAPVYDYIWMAVFGYTSR